MAWGTHALYPEWFQTAEINAAPLEAASTPTVQRGAYLAKIGNCAGCHTARDGAAYAGGRGIDTPFGVVYSSNLTSDATYGLGAWSAQDFWNAMHLGRTRDGSVLNPAFPYTSFTHLSRTDSDALFAYLRTVAPSATVRPPHTITWPLGSQIALRAWRALYFTPSVALADAPQGGASAVQQQARGEYLVKGLGHCAECHAQRNSLGGMARHGDSAGSIMPMTAWFAPPLQSTAAPADWSVDALSALLRTGYTVGATHRSVGGPMAEVVARSTQFLTEADAKAMAAYLVSTTTHAAGASAVAPTSVQAKGRGAELYEKHCEECHGQQGEGIAGAYPALAGNPAVNRPQFNNLALKVLRGGFAPSTASNPRPYGMPPYMLTFSEAEVAAVLTHLRSSWGNTGAAVSEFDINRLKASIHP